MRNAIARITLASILVLAPAAATAQTSLDYNAQFSPGTTVAYLPFTVSVAGNFSLFTTGLNNLDPMIWLFSGAAWDGSGLGAAMAVNDDGGFAQAGWNTCTGVGGTCHSMISGFLGVGDYTLVAGVFQLTEAEARAGAANIGPQDLVPGTFYNGPYCNAQGDWSTCNYDVHIKSSNGLATTATPEPATMLLVGTGLAGLGAARRRRKAKTA